MAWASVSDFLTDSRMFVWPFIIAALFLAVFLVKRGKVSWESWDRIFSLEAFLFPFTAGIVWGPQIFARFIDNLSGDGLGVTWAGIITALLLILATVLMFLSVRRLATRKGWNWLGVALEGYVIGAWAHVFVTLGEPFRSWYL